MEPPRSYSLESTIEAFRSLAYVQCGSQKTLSLIATPKLAEKVDEVYCLFASSKKKEVICTEEECQSIHRAVVWVSHAYQRSLHDLKSMLQLAKSRKIEKWYVGPSLRDMEKKTIEREFYPTKTQLNYSSEELQLFKKKLSYIEESEQLDRMKERLKQRKKELLKTRCLIDFVLNFFTEALLQESSIKVNSPITLWKPEPYLRYDPVKLLKTIAFIHQFQETFVVFPDEEETFIYVKKNDKNLPFTLLIPKKQDRDQGLSVVILIKKGWRSEGGEKVVKPSCFIKIQKDSVTIIPSVIARVFRNIQNEVRYLQEFKDDPHVIDLLTHGTYLTTKREKKDVIVLPMFEGNLSELMKQMNRLSAETVNSMAKQLFSALQTFNEQEFVHGDIKPGNILYKWVSDKEVILKVIDFGFSYFKKLKAAKIGGTSTFVSPQYANSLSDPTRDIFAAGIIFYYFTQREVPDWLKKCASFEQARRELRTYPFKYFEEIEKLKKNHPLFKHVVTMLNPDPKVRRTVFDLSLELEKAPEVKERVDVPIKFDMMVNEKLDLSDKPAYIEYQKGLIPVHELSLSTETSPRPSIRPVKCQEPEGYMNYFKNVRIW